MSNREATAEWHPDGWFSLPGPGGKGGVHARVVADRDGRVTLTDLYVHGAEVTSGLLRMIPIGRIEAMANSGHVAETMKLYPKALRRDVPMDELRKRVPKKTPQPTRRHEPLTRPDGTDPDSFSRRVADAYNAAVRTTSRPAKVLAEEAGVPVTTVHRWIREARQRGFLPPAKKGRAG